MSTQARGYELRGKRIWVAGHRGMVKQGFPRSLRLVRRERGPRP
jgi:hypothetical protein